MTPQELAVGLMCYLGPLTISASMFWSSPLVTWLSSNESSIQLSDTAANIIVAIYAVPYILTIYPAGYVATRFGRKIALACAYPIGVLSFILALVAFDFLGLLVARLLQGVVIGILTTVGPEYGAETARDNTRGFAICMFYTVFAVGGLLTAVTGSFLAYTTYTAICLALPAIGSICIHFMPESPHFLLMNGDKAGAEKSLKWLRNTNDVSDEVERILKAIEKDESAGYKSLFTYPEHRRPLIVGIIITLGSTVIGYPAIPTYAFNLFPSTTDLNFSSDTLAILINVFTVLGAISVTFLVDSWGRRPLILLSASSCCLFSLMIILYLMLQELTSPVSVEFSLFLLISVIGFTYFIAFIQSLQVLTQAELFATTVRTEAAVVIQIVNSTSTLIQLALYPIINNYLGVIVNFILYLIYSVVFLGCMKFLMPETAKLFLGKIVKISQ